MITKPDSLWRAILFFHRSPSNAYALARKPVRSSNMAGNSAAAAMRRSGWLLPLLAAAVWVAAVGYPAVALLPALVADTPVNSAGRTFHRKPAPRVFSKNGDGDLPCSSGPRRAKVAGAWGSESAMPLLGRRQRGSALRESP